jgi:hypothetical protein
MPKKIKPICLCSNCDQPVIPTKADAGRFLLQFRKTPTDPVAASRYGKMGGRGNKKKVNV